MKPLSKEEVKDIFYQAFCQLGIDARQRYAMSVTDLVTDLWPFLKDIIDIFRSSQPEHRYLASGYTCCVCNGTGLEKYMYLNANAESVAIGLRPCTRCQVDQQLPVQYHLPDSLVTFSSVGEELVAAQPARAEPAIGRCPNCGGSGFERYRRPNMFNPEMTVNDCRPCPKCNSGTHASLAGGCIASGQVGNNEPSVVVGGSVYPLPTSSHVINPCISDKSIVVQSIKCASKGPHGLFCELTKGHDGMCCRGSDLHGLVQWGKTGP